METLDVVHPETVNERIGATVHEQRARHGLSLEALALASWASRSALSLIERAESSPTAAILDKLAAGLAVPLASLFGCSRPETASR